MVSDLTPHVLPPSHRRRAESVLVLIVRPDAQTLMLERQGWPGFWQSVTGGLERGESAEQAALRELAEETGLRPQELMARGVQRRFEIFPAYQHKYSANTRFNLEYEFIAQVDAKAAVRLDPREHTRYQWLPITQAVTLALSWSNRCALRHYAWEQSGLT